MEMEIPVKTGREPENRRSVVALESCPAEKGLICYKHTGINDTVVLLNPFHH